jgi:AraC-like DNA-binding protein
MIARTMADGVLSQTAIARRLGLSVATLRRRLDAQGEGFRGIRERVLSERARWELTRTTSVSRAAEALGFSDSRSFSRAFQAWTGMTPAAFIRSNGAPATSEA